MGVLKKAYYRTFQAVFNIGARVLPWRKATRIDGAGSIAQIPGLLQKHGVRKPLIVTDQGLMKAGIAPRIMKVLEDAGIPYALFDTVEPNPSVDTVNAIHALYVREQCGGLVAIGGGSSMDAAKAAGALAAFPKKTVNQLSGLLRVYKRIPPLIAVPTTAGTGSETTIAALITDTKTHHKRAIMDLHLIPLYAVLDPELTVGLPPAITAATGMDALTHAVEAYLCWTYNTKESIRFAEEATVLIFENLEKVYKDGSDVHARNEMLIAAYKAGFAFTRAGVGNIHAIAHTLGGLYNTPHGLANAVILPVVLEDYSKSSYGNAVYQKLARLAELTGTMQEGGEAEKAHAFIQAIRDMNRRMGIPDSFDVIMEEDIPQMVAWALKECNPLYPVPVIYDETRCASIIQSIRKEKPYCIGEACNGCGACAQLCPVYAIEGERGERHAINPERCVRCGVCGRVCPQSAVSDHKGQPCTRVPRSSWPVPCIDTALCSACGMCVAVCSANALVIPGPENRGDINVSATLDPKKCVGCALCEAECPLHAIAMKEGEPA